MMIINTVKGQVKPEFKDKFIAHMRDLSKIVRNEKGCIAYDLSVDTENDLILFLYEQWESKEAITVHLATAHMQKHLAEAQPWFDTLEMNTFEATAISL
ncbi:putative quinol monooxygenase [Vibrio alfacsensis]|uniref:putative quinol monooxygenase n=1 Tax=Vibrio alfacsensis TaxID=1074311 RepID=UPI00406849A3